MKFKQIYLEITKECNLRCSFCPAIFSKGKYMSLEQIETAIINTKDYTDTYYLHILGEPLLYPELSNLLTISDKHNKKIKITTNGILLKKCQDVLFLHSSVKQVNISIQSWIKFSTDYQEELINDVVNFIIKNNNKLTVMIRFWNDKNNIEVYEKNKYIYNQLITKLKQHFNEIENIENINLNEIKNLIRLKPYLFISIEDEFSWPSLDNKINNLPNKCLGGKTQLGILNNGDVVLCCLDYLGYTKLGNIFDNNLKYILNNRPYIEFKEYLMKQNSFFELCKKCDFRNRFN